ncbi:MAG: 5'/3'-nucleotidase SurE [Candidatus Gastranaerophilales bacterium]|nr:5'/3'-nucleotidase SurE [Candidatus Gastranaerophilales bacterium]
MKILIANDDGIQATGINTLAKELCNENEVYIVAPDQERSAAGHALTLNMPIRVREVDLGIPVAKAYAISGTPGDCVKMGITEILDVKPDLVISGINHGPNLGADVLYSGTVSAAMEGAVLGYPSIAVSLCDLNGSSYNIKPTAKFVSNFIKKIHNINFPKKTILNINVPDGELKDMKGVCIVKLDMRMYTVAYEKHFDTRGKVYYWMAGEPISENHEQGTDISAVLQNKISITPVTFEMTHKSIMPDLEVVFATSTCE